MLGSVLKHEKMSPTNPLSITWYIACVLRSYEKERIKITITIKKLKFAQMLNGS